MMNRPETATMILKFYNMTAGTAFRTSNEWNVKKVFECMDALNDDWTFTATMRAHIKDWVKNNPSKKLEMNECFDEFIEKHSKPADKPETDKPAVTPAVTETQAGNALSLIEQAVADIIVKTKAEEIKASIMGSVADSVRSFIASEYGAIERKITTVIDGKKVPMQGIVHDKFDTVLKFVANDEPVFLTGPAGSGKNVICKQVAEALGLNFYFTNAVTQEYKLTGFTDAMGTYHATQFYKAFTEGGVFMLDEMDASIPEVLVILNAAIANRYFDFPAPIGYVEAHKDFRVIAAGNTTGNGADIAYVGRNQLDAASLDRFAVVKIDYSMAIENSVVAGDIELADFCRDFRKSANKAGLNIIVSYRAMGRLAKMVQIMTAEDAIDTCLVKGLDVDDLKIVENGLTVGGKYRNALKNLIKAVA